MKYQEDLAAISNCPPTNGVSKNTTAYRFVFNPVNSDSFIPPGKQNPARLQQNNTQHKQCSLLALSMFKSCIDAENHFDLLKKKIPNIGKLIGEHLAEGNVMATDGIQTKPNSKGHFDFFEGVNADLPSQFKIIKQM
ncbi:hypothetical protein CAG70_13020 [Photobacterium halotolerans]|uniref:hypothetical protein n=1 Tax=Photobacterium halotolerans TaxID=265726 RepID=UPI001373134F|nr:hypothetical protein [Photobacterium halotolerans]NAX47903.1 hypothetical protein [Photobacterium halotolerans]